MWEVRVMKCASGNVRVVRKTINEWQDAMVGINTGHARSVVRVSLLKNKVIIRRKSRNVCECDGKSSGA